jgi:hypothetical protein
MIRSLTALALLLLAGCTTHGRLADPMTFQSDAAEIVVIREWRFIGSGVNLTVSVDDAPVYGMGNNEHVIMRVSPGQHIVGVSLRTALNESTVSVQTEAYRRYYFRVETASFGDGPLLQPVTAEMGQRLMNKTTLIKQ